MDRSILIDYLMRNGLNVDKVFQESNFTASHDSFVIIVEHFQRINFRKFPYQKKIQSTGRMYGVISSFHNYDSVEIYDLATMSLKCIMDHGHHVYTVEVALWHESYMLISAGQAGTINIWDLDSGVLIR